MDIRCKKLIQNWQLIEDNNLDLSNVVIDSLSVEDHGCADGSGWEISLETTIGTQITNDGRDIYWVKWLFRDVFGYPPSFMFNGRELSGKLSLFYVEHDVLPHVIFRIEGSGKKVIFEFTEPDTIIVDFADYFKHEEMFELDPF